MNSDNIVARIDATFENTLQLDAELGEVTQIGKCKVLYGTTEEWNNQPELVAKEGYIYIYSDHKQNEEEQNIASFKVGDGSSLLIELPFTDDILYEDIAALQTEVEDIPTTADELPYDNTVSGLESTNVNDAIDEVEDRVDEAEGDIVTLGTNKADKVNPTTSGTLTHTGNATVSGSVTATGGFVGNLTGTASEAIHASSADSATNATHATSADSATNASHATTAGSATTADQATSATYADSAATASEATHATSADSATSAGNANTVNNLTVLTAVPANAVFTDTTYTLGTDGNTIKLTPSSGSAQTITAPYASNAGTVNSHSVNADVPSGAKFTDTDYLVDLKDVEVSNLADGQVLVWDAVAKKFKNITLPDAVVFRGSLGTGGTITVLPVDGSARIGDMYKVITDGTYAGQASKIGDTFICLTKTSNANTWVYIPSGDEPSGTVTSVKIEGSGAIVVNDESAITTSGVRTISHANSGATAGSYGDSSAQTPAYGATFKVPYITVDAKGHITGISEHTVKIPDSDNTDELSELTDVSLTSPTQGQILKYNGSTWENANEVVPTEVVANPTGTATTDLTKIQVGNDIYAIPEGGTDVEITQIQSTGTKIATIIVDNVPTDLYAPEGGGGGSSTFAGLDDVDFNNLQNGQVPMYDSANSEWINGEIKLGTKTAFSVPINLASKTGNGLVQTFFTYTADNDQFLNVITTGTTDCGSNEAYISLSKNGTEVERYTLITNTATTHNFAQLNLIEGDTITLKFGWVNNHGAKLNGTANFLSIVGNPRLQPVIYSTAEREIGVWTDGKPLYQKTIPFNCTSSTVTEYVMDNNVDIKGYDARGSWAVRSNHNIISLNSCISGDSTYSVFITFGSDNGDNNIIDIRHQRKDITNVVVTILYTKTTDVAGSGTWTPQGVPAVHYSTDEQVVGTWIDGRTVYEKTLTPSGSFGDTFNYIPHGVSNFDQLLDYYGFCTYGSSDKINIPNVRGSSYVTVSAWDTTNIRLERANLSSAVSDVKMVIRYTKSST